MTTYSRFGIYFAPKPGPLAEFGATWLGWDLECGTAQSQFDVPGIREFTDKPRKYGFHGTLKPPFRLADGRNAKELESELEELCSELEPARSGPLELSKLGHFLAFTPTGDMEDLAELAARLVQNLDRFRAEPGESELARRRAAGLTPAQEANLADWGYPYVLDEFRFHLTLSGKLSAEDQNIAAVAIKEHAPTLKEPFTIDQVALVGERQDGMFELIRRIPLGR